MLQLPCVPHHRGQILFEVGRDRDGAEALPHEEQYVTEQGVEVDPVGHLHLLPSGKVEKVLRQGGRPLRRGFDHIGIPVDLSLILGHSLYERGVAEDAREHVVEIVSDASGELADALHPVLVDVLFFLHPQVDDVLEDKAFEDDLPRIVLYGITLHGIEPVVVALLAVEVHRGG